MSGLQLRKRQWKDRKRRSFPRTFGTTTNLVDCEFDLNLSNFNQNVPNSVTGDPALPEACTAFLRADMATNEDRIIYDPQFTYDKACFEQNVPVGSPLPLQAAFDSGRVDGLKAVGEPEGNELNHRRGPYAQVHPVAGQDWFDAIWSALSIGQRPVGAGTLWYNQLTQNVTVDSVQTGGPSNGHAWEITGVTTTDQPRMHVKWWNGEPKWFGRQTINTLLSIGGSDCLMDVDGKATLADLKSVGFVYTLRTMLLSLLQRLFTLQSGSTAPVLSLWKEIEVDVEEEIEKIFSKPKPIITTMELEQTPQNNLANFPAQQTASTSTPGPDILVPWDTTGSLSHANFHNVRVLCDLEGLSYEMKNELCATVWGESEFNTHALCENHARTPSGVAYIASVDNGICQWNTHYHGAEITPDEAINDPEMAVRLMCKYFLAGKANQWVAFSSGRYLQFMGKSL